MFDASQLVGIMLCRIEARELNRLVAHRAEGFVHGVRIESRELEIGFCTRDKVREHLCEGVQSFEVHIGSIHHIDGTRFGNDGIEDVHIMHISLRNVEKRRNISA